MKNQKCCATTDSGGAIVGALVEGAVACQSDAVGSFKRANTFNPSCEAHKEALGAFLGQGFTWATPAR